MTSYRDPPVDRMTNASESITLPQTSFVGGNNSGRNDVNLCGTFVVNDYDVLPGTQLRSRSGWNP